MRTFAAAESPHNAKSPLTAARATSWERPRGRLSRIFSPSAVLGPQIQQRPSYAPGGTLDALGQNNFNRPVNTFSIVGGTGRYATARGEVIVRSLGNPQTSNTSAITVRIWR